MTKDTYLLCIDEIPSNGPVRMPVEEVGTLIK